MVSQQVRHDHEAVKNPKESGDQADGVFEVLRRLTDDACEVALFSRVRYWGVLAPLPALQRSMVDTNSSISTEQQ